MPDYIYDQRAGVDANDNGLNHELLRWLELVRGRQISRALRMALLPLMQTVPLPSP